MNNNNNNKNKYYSQTNLIRSKKQFNIESENLNNLEYKNYRNKYGNNLIDRSLELIYNNSIILNFKNNNIDQIITNFNFLEYSHIVKSQKNEEEEKLYQVNINLNKNEKIFKCGCIYFNKTNRNYCKHILACLIIEKFNFSFYKNDINSLNKFFKFIIDNNYYKENFSFINFLNEFKKNIIYFTDLDKFNNYIRNNFNNFSENLNQINPILQVLNLNQIENQNEDNLMEELLTLD
jgi:hypothetical protein